MLRLQPQQTHPCIEYRSLNMSGTIQATTCSNEMYSTSQKPVSAIFAVCSHSHATLLQTGKGECTLGAAAPSTLSVLVCACWDKISRYLHEVYVRRQQCDVMKVQQDTIGGKPLKILHLPKHVTSKPPVKTSLGAPLQHWGVANLQTEALTAMFNCTAV